MIVPNVYIENASLTYDNEPVFAHLNLHLPAGKWVALLGQSGIGKSSLMRLLAGLTSAKEISHGGFYADNQLPISSQIAYMAQHDLLLPWLPVISNATLGMELRNHSKAEQNLLIDKAKQLLEKVGLSHAIYLYPYQLSGGMRQRVALVRTLMEDKPIVLMDEPFSAIDTISRYKLQELAKELLNNKTVLFITHDPTEALRLADEIYIMHGQPAQLKWVSSLTSLAPRSLSNPELINLQPHLFQELLQTTSALS